MNLRNFDLNLLVIFRDLYITLNVTQTAANLGLSQPAVSHALNRLRESLGDELFVRAGGIFVATDKAKHLGNFVNQYLNDLENNLFDQHQWQAKESDKSFKISGTAYDSFVWFPLLMRSLQADAPAIKFEMKGIVLESFLERMASGQIDLSFAGNLSEIKNFSVHTLAHHKFCILSNKSSKLYKKKISINQYLDAEHILYTPTEKPGSEVDDYFQKNNKKRNIVIRTSYLNSIPMLIEKRDFLCIVPLSYGQRVIKHYDVKIHDVPFHLEDFEHQMVWHKSKDSSSSNKWLREYIIGNYSSFF